MGPRAWVLLSLVACGTSRWSPDASVAPDASEDMTLDVPAFPGAGDGSGVVIVTDLDASVVDGGGWFMCGQCPCDGRTHYCDIGSGPHAPLSADASDDASCPYYSTCTPLPDGCAPARCSCLIRNTGVCACYPDDAGAGLYAGCFYP